MAVLVLDGRGNLGERVGRDVDGVLTQRTLAVIVMGQDTDTYRVDDRDG